LVSALGLRSADPSDPEGDEALSPLARCLRDSGTGSQGLSGLSPGAQLLKGTGQLQTSRAAGRSDT
ncbi:unnamed protein product, partial [Polarella glacialis]